MSGVLNESDRIRFDAKWIPEPNTGCHLWSGSHNSYGYGRVVRTHDSRQRITLAHRISWELSHGTIPHGLFVLHKCDTRACVNPAHLFLGTIADNNADRDRKGRHRVGVGDRHGSVTHPERVVRGEQHPKAKLSAADVDSIRRMISDGVGPRRIARMFGVAHGTVDFIKAGKTWRAA